VRRIQIRRQRPDGEDVLAKVDVDGVGVEYEVLGSGTRSAVITPGGRWTKETSGVRGLAEELAKGGLRVVIWDRPNSGGSDVYFGGSSEATQAADVLAGLLRHLGMAPAIVIGGSGGSRQSLLVATRHPDVVDRLFLFLIQSGMSVVQIAYGYYIDSWVAAATGGMEAVAALPLWKDLVERNPRNRDILLSQDPPAFMRKMKDWTRAWIASFDPGADEHAPECTPSDLAALEMPVMILNSGKSDFYHPRETTEAVHAMIPGSKLVDPPWGDREWTELMAEMNRSGSGGGFLFSRWPLLAPRILAFADM
jgi:pimeloyl-ACP methyl ester carboxylesterase